MVPIGLHNTNPYVHFSVVVYHISLREGNEYSLGNRELFMNMLVVNYK